MSKKKSKPVPAWIEALSSGTAPEEAPAGWAVAQEWLAEGSGQLEGLKPRLALSAIEAAASTQAVPRLQGLDDSPDKGLRKAARRALHRLRSSGVVIEDTPRSTTFSLRKEAVAVAPKAFLGFPHQEGYAPFLLSTTDDEGSCILAGEVGGGQGVRNTYHLHVTRGDLREVWKDAVQSSELVEIDFTTGLHFVRSGMEHARSLTGAAPKDWPHFLGHLAEGTLTAAQLLDPAAGLASTLDTAALREMAETDPLTVRPWFSYWPLPKGAMEKLFADLEEQLGSELEISPELEQERRDRAFADAADEAFAEVEVREQWRAHLGIAVAILRAQGDQDAATEAHNVALAVEQGLAGHEIPPVMSSLRYQAFRFATMLGQLNAAPTE